jgi:hypothetical protein
MDGGMRQPGLLPDVVAADAISVSPVQVSRTDDGADRRQSGGRARARDRLMDRATRTYAVSETLSHARGVENLVLFIDDDLRETGLALGSVETYLVGILKLLEAPKMTREEVHALAADTQVLDHVDMLVETLETLRRRLAKLASSLR